MKILAFIYFIITSIIYILTNKNILKININLIKHKIINKCNNLKLYILNTISNLNNNLNNRLSQDCLGKKILKNISNTINFNAKRDTLSLIIFTISSLYLALIFWFSILELILGN